MNTSTMQEQTGFTIVENLPEWFRNGGWDAELITQMMSLTDLFECNEYYWNRLIILAPELRLIDARNRSLFDAWQRFYRAVRDERWMNITVSFNNRHHDQIVNATTPFNTTVQVYTKEFFTANGDQSYRTILRSQFDQSAGALAYWHEGSAGPLRRQLADGQLSVRAYCEGDPTTVRVLRRVADDIVYHNFDIAVASAEIHLIA